MACVIAAAGVSADAPPPGLFRTQLKRYRAGLPLANVVGKKLGFIPAG